MTSGSFRGPLKTTFTVAEFAERFQAEHSEAVLRSADAPATAPEP